jgi:hypothetical protein
MEGLAGMRDHEQALRPARDGSTRRRASVLLGGCLAVLLLDAVPARAQEATTEAGPADRWSFAVAPYLWMLSLDGNASVAGVDADVDVPFSDAIKDLSFGGMLLGTVRKGRFGFVVNGIFTRVSPDASVGAFDIDATSDLASVAAAPFYRIAEWTYGEGADGQPRRFVLEPYAGARWNYLRLELDVRGGRQVDQSEGWVDPIVGTRFGLDLTDRWFLAGAADVGGVVTGSDLAWNVQAYLAYKTQLFGNDAVLSFGYRALHTNYDNDQFEWDVTQHGPIIGTMIRF